VGAGYLEVWMVLSGTLARCSDKLRDPCSETWQQDMQLQQQYDGV